MAKTSTALREWIEDEGTPLERRAIIVQGPASFCAYVGVPADHPLAGRHYDDMRLDVHGGLTFGREGKDGSPWPKGWYWYGWDYAHAGDFMSFAPNLGGYAWTVEEIEQHARTALDQLKDLLADAMVD